MRKIRSCLGLVSVVALSACVATVWDRPGTTQAVLNMDNAQCQLYAEGAVPDFDPGTVSTGQIERDLAVNAAAGIIGGIVHGVAISQRHDLCMGAQRSARHRPCRLCNRPMPASKPRLSEQHRFRRWLTHRWH